MKPKRVAIVVVVLLVVVGVSAGWSAWRNQNPEQKSFDFTGPELTVVADEGDLELVPVTGQDGRVSVTRWFKTNKWLGNTGADWQLEGGRTLQLTSHCEGMFARCDVRYRLEVPARTKLRVRAQDGTVRGNGFVSDLAIETRDGDIELDDARGPLSLVTDDGTIRATGLATPRVSARSGDGDVRLDFLAAPESVVATTDDGQIDVAAPDGPYKITTKVDDGDAESTLPHDPAAQRTIDASARDGDISIHRR
ncbi:DUF4097 family beta strand repeat-containing protein [Microlunatus parietis]|uniref:DUF4097 domain-containing protein n=1 Tax=Microlunatus parietis TaxID=682979 RepID=A0A7Y9I3Y6_9ACTN|nr:DUF4097 family beta strand repeat-containing protein [Microlunatus parietis]NYE69535.1 hypothetical protein [Microlunatus parietis]